jgi:hypothetical protein
MKSELERLTEAVRQAEAELRRDHAQRPGHRG